MTRTEITRAQYRRDGLRYAKPNGIASFQATPRV